MKTYTLHTDGGHGWIAVKLSELDELGRQIAELSNEIHENSERGLAREARFADAADLLLDTQSRLVSQLETVLARVSAIKQQNPGPKPRAIA